MMLIEIFIRCLLLVMGGCLVTLGIVRLLYWIVDRWL